MSNTYLFQEPTQTSSGGPVPFSVGHNQSQIVSQYNPTTSTNGQLSFFAFDTAAREGFRVSTSGSAATVGFFGVTAVVQQTGGAATAGATYTSAEQGMVNRMYTALRAYGLLT